MRPAPLHPFPRDVAELDTPDGWHRFCRALGLHLTLTELWRARAATRPPPPTYTVVPVRQATVRLEVSRPPASRPDVLILAGVLTPVPGPPPLTLPTTRPAGNRAHRRQQRRPA